MIAVLGVLLAGTVAPIGNGNALTLPAARHLVRMDTGGEGDQSLRPSQRHHWKKTSWRAEPSKVGASYEYTSAMSFPTVTRSGVSRSLQSSWMGA